VSSSAGAGTRKSTGDPMRLSTAGFPYPPIVVSGLPGEEAVRPEKIATILKSGWDASNGVMTLNEDDDKMNVLEQECYLPATDDGVPNLGCASWGERLFHCCRSLLLGHTSGESMADLIAQASPKTSTFNRFLHCTFRDIQP
jgi:hypothetical protein